MAAAHTEQAGDADIRTVRLDLTRLDLRSGTIRLPLQEHDCFPPGSLRGVSQSGGAEHQLRFESPRELHGLRDFFEENGLRPNDAVIIHLHDNHVELEPLRRKSRRKPGVAVATPDEPELPDAEPEAGPEAAEPASLDPAANASGELQPDSAPDADLSSASAGEVTHAFQERESESSEAPAATAATADISEQQPPGPELRDRPEPALDQSTRVTRYPFLAEEPATPEPPLQPPAEGQTGKTPAPEETAQETTPPAERSDAPYHATRRRPFTPRERGPAWVATRPAAPWLEAAARARSQHDSPADAAAATSRPEEAASSTETAAPAPTAAGPEAAVRHWLERPDLPSIIQAAQVARQLQLEKEETSAILEKLSSEPDSRLSRVRPGFWLLKRQQPGS